MEKLTDIEKYNELLCRIPLFCDLPQNVKATLLGGACQAFRVNKKEEVARQGTIVRRLYVLLRGRLRVDIIDSYGNQILIEHINAPRSFATIHLFNTVDNTLPVNYTALEDCILFTVSKESFFKLLCENPVILRNFLSVAGNCNRSIMSRLNVLSHKDVRGRLVTYFFEQKESGSHKVQILHNQVQLANYMNVTRQALSKEIKKMIKEKLIKVEGKTIELLKGNRPEYYLL